MSPEQLSVIFFSSNGHNDNHYLLLFSSVDLFYVKRSPLFQHSIQFYLCDFVHILITCSTKCLPIVGSLAIHINLLVKSVSRRCLSVSTETKKYPQLVIGHLSLEPYLYHD